MLDVQANKLGAVHVMDGVLEDVTEDALVAVMAVEDAMVAVQAVAMVVQVVVLAVSVAVREAVLGVLVVAENVKGPVMDVRAAMEAVKAIVQQVVPGLVQDAKIVPVYVIVHVVVDAQLVVTPLVYLVVRQLVPLDVLQHVMALAQRHV